MKIAVAAPTTLPALRANTIQVMKMTQALVELGHEVRLSVPSPNPDKISHRWDKLARQYGLQHEFAIDWLQADGRWRGYDFGVRALQHARRMGAQLLYTRHPQSAALASLSGMPVVLEAHDMPHGRMGGLLFDVFLRGRGARRLVIITNALAGDLKARFGMLRRRCAADDRFALVAPDGVDMARYAGLPRAEDARDALKSLPDLPFAQLNPERFSVGYTGHLYPGRGAELLLGLAQNLPQMQFLVAGGEPETVASFRRAAAERNLYNLILTGFLENADLPLVQAACDVLLMPYQARVEASSGGDISRYLSPMKAFEYLACGRAILVSDLAVFREIFNDSNAVLVPHDDAGAWVKALAALEQDSERRTRLGERARQDVQQYEWVRRAENILRELRV